MRHIAYLFRTLRYWVLYYFEDWHPLPWKAILPDGSWRRFQFKNDMRVFVWYQHLYAKEPLTEHTHRHTCVLGHDAKV